MYYNVFGEKVSRRRFKEMCDAAKNRRELIAAGLTSRRDLFKMGLLTAGGMLVAKSGLSARAQTTPQTGGGAQTTTNNPPSSADPNQSPGTNQNCVPGNQTQSPDTKAFVTPLPIIPLAVHTASSLFSPQPTIAPNPASGTDGSEHRAFAHQGPDRFPNQFPSPSNNGLGNNYYRFHQRQFTTNQMSPQLPTQTLWGFDDGTGTRSPGPTYKAIYGVPQLTRNINSLPPITQKNNTGFGFPSATTHLHNGHTPSESDGNPCDFYPNGQFCDQYYPNVLAGFSTSPFAPNGDPNESLATLWYHDHRVDFTSQNTYKGLVGFYCLFNNQDTGDEGTGFHLPSFTGSSDTSQNFDIPLMFNDKVFDPTTGDLVFDLFNLDGILGDKFLVNGVIQPFLQVSPRRYRFRMLDTGPSRFYEFFLTQNPATNPVTVPFFLIGTDGNLLPTPIQVTSVRIGPAERVEVIVDFTNFAGQTLYFENRLNQLNGQGPVAVDSQLFPQNDPVNTECTNVLAKTTPAVKHAGAGDLILQFKVTGPQVADHSVDPATKPHFYNLPDTTATPRITRTFKFDRLNGQWSINGQFMDCGIGPSGFSETFRFTVQENSVEQWLLTNLTGDWTHPVHIHLEEHQILTRNRKAPTVPADLGRKDVTQLHPNERVQLFFRFRDWLHKYPIHCHNVVHEDHAMMALWHIEATGDNILVP
jgi:FtsP/CotA-like multicopper oxidase with cupredoxin domain